MYQRERKKITHVEKEVLKVYIYRVHWQIVLTPAKTHSSINADWVHYYCNVQIIDRQTP